MRDVVLVDAGGSNLGSVRHALERLGVDAAIAHDPARIRNASHVIVPGVGAAASGMRRLAEQGLLDVLRGLTQPVLGICLGMQLLFEHSAEGDVDALGILPGRVVALPPAPRVRVPHMGWNTLEICRDDALLEGIECGAYVYFVHSFAVPACAVTLATMRHGQAWSALVRQDNFCGMQFHPERSSAVGARMLRNFIES